jgi:chorismate synthase
VAAGAIAEKYLKLTDNLEIVAFTSSVGSEHLFPSTPEHPTPATNPEFLSMIRHFTRVDVDKFVPTRCPEEDAAARIAETIAAYRDHRDSIGGIITCVIRNAPTGLGEPAFDKLGALLAQAMLSIPATKGFEIGSEFGGCSVPGSVHNDAFIKSTDGSRLTTKTNNSGGVHGSITNGSEIPFRVAFKPAATIGQA